MRKLLGLDPGELNVSVPVLSFSASLWGSCSCVAAELAQFQDLPALPVAFGPCTSPSPARAPHGASKLWSGRWEMHAPHGASDGRRFVLRGLEGSDEGHPEGRCFPLTGIVEIFFSQLLVAPWP